MPEAAPPTAEDLLDWLKLTGANYDLQDAQEAIDTATDNQFERCDLSVFTDALREARLRRAARILAGRGAPQGVIDLGPMGGAVPIARWDALIEENEMPYRKGGFA